MKDFTKIYELIESFKDNTRKKIDLMNELFLTLKMEEYIQDCPEHIERVYAVQYDSPTDPIFKKVLFLTDKQQDILDKIQNMGIYFDKQTKKSKKLNNYKIYSRRRDGTRSGDIERSIT